MILNLKYILFVLLYIGTLFFAFAQSKTAQEYEKNYKSDFYEALNFLKQNKILFAQELNKDGGDVRAIAAIAFPEMVRYSELSNLFESATVEVLYVKFGTKYADFSIGNFQMKPSFIEKVEAYLEDNKMAMFSDVWKFNETEETEIRQKRISRMKTLKWQLRYLRAFYAIMTYKFPSQLTQTDHKIRFMAAAYNRGFDKTETEITRWSKVDAFPHGARYTGKQYNYADIAYYFYYKHSIGIF